MLRASQQNAARLAFVVAIFMSASSVGKCIKSYDGGELRQSYIRMDEGLHWRTFLRPKLP